ncbi:helicase [Niastella koreensis]|uniref:DEAD/DEAH box helicase domain protein n=2 Tax=Niastella koreensis TaxID=354356 RepID=G8TPH2_NIAKG|nr:DEAD/DEAH box helicase [Niastella koreensis]AEV97793.1 DEAD/DEAH box helicase domain protein [Niastella koreensis GR20-10]OQP40396.1 helicase [Niastella koreensis]
MAETTFSIENTLSNLQIDELNEMQQASLEANKTSNSVVLLADTGSGKTLAFLLPVTQLLDKRHVTQALIIVPSRELALQIEQVFKKMGTGFKITCCYGGHKRETEENNLLQAPALIVGTPGRLADHIRRGNITTTHIETLVLDEFDKSLEEGFDEEMSFIISSLPALKKRILTSATEAVEVPEFVGLQDPVKINFLTGEKSEALAIQTVKSSDRDKAETLFRLICHLGNRSTIVFCNQREFVETVNNFLKEKGIVSVFYHGAMEQRDRDVALCKFRNGSSNVLVTTDLAARGLDIPNIRYIVHYQLPTSQESFTHRNGRTARMDASGTAILILAPHEYLPEYITPEPANIELPENAELPQKPGWTTFFIGAGKKDKINKVDIVGFFTNRGQLKKEDIGLIEVKDFFSFVAIRKSKASHTLHSIKDEKIKNKKVKIDVAK